MRTLDSSSIASRAAGLTISEEMLERAESELKELEERSKSEVVAQDALDLHRKQIQRAQTRLLMGKKGD